MRKKVATVLKTEIEERTLANDIWMEEWESPDEDKDEPFEVVPTLLMGGDPTNIYWQAAHVLVLNDEYESAKDFYIDQGDRYRVAPGHTLADMEGSEEVQPFKNNIGGYRQLLAIESYIRNPKNGLGLWEIISKANRFVSDDDTTLEDLHCHRKMLVRKCLEKMTEPFESEEVKFTKHCMAIKLASQQEGYCIDSSTFNPYNDMLTLSRIVEIVMCGTGAPFTFQDGGMMEEMRDYVTTYGNALFFKE